MKLKSTLLLSLAFLLIGSGVVLAQSGGAYEIAPYVLADAGDFVGGGAYQVGFTVGQDVETPVIAGGDYQVVQGVWAGGGFPEAETLCGVGVGGNTFTFAFSAPVYITVTALGDLDCLSVEPVIGYDPPYATAGLLTGRYWTIRGTNSSGDAASGFELTMTLPAGFAPDANDRLCRYTGSGVTWDCGTDVANTSGANTVTRSGITQLSRWAIGNDVGPTEVTLHGLRARARGLSPALIALGGMLLLGVGWSRIHRRGRRLAD